jgi:excisionase family DNA binding protein
MNKRSKELSNDRVLTVREAKDILQVGWGTIYNYIYDGSLKAHKLGGNISNNRRHWRIWHSDLMAFVNGEESKE